jgi:hypothetical protein
MFSNKFMDYDNVYSFNEISSDCYYYYILSSQLSQSTSIANITYPFEVRVRRTIEKEEDAKL